MDVCAGRILRTHCGWQQSSEIDFSDRVATVKSIHRNPETAGIGLRLAHLSEVVTTRPSITWVEIHPANFLANPHAAELLSELSVRHAISLHSVGISIGSASGIDRHYLKRIRSLVDRIDPILVSGHLAWSTYGNEYLNDLLPLPYNEESLGIIAVHISQV